MTKEKYNLFIRYLKERGLYKAFLNDAKMFPERRQKMHIKKYLLQSGIVSGEEIMHLITWDLASYREWNSEYLNYYNFLNEIKRLRKNEIYRIFEKKDYQKEL